MGKHRGNTNEEWPKKLDLSDHGISQILTDAFARLKDGGNGILPLLRECYPEFTGENGPESFFRAIGLLDEKGELRADKGKIPLRALCEARGQFENALGAFAENAEISPSDVALLEGPINDAVEAVRQRVEEWKKEQADAKQVEQDEIRSTQRRIAKPGDDIEVGKTILKGTLKVEMGEDGGIKMSFWSDSVVFLRSPFSERKVPAEKGIMVRCAKGVLKRLSGKVGPGKSVSVNCIAKIADLKIVEKRERNEHNFYIDVVSVTPEDFAGAKTFDTGGARIPLGDSYKVEDPEGEKVEEGEGFKGFKKIEIGKTEVSGTLLAKNTSVGSLVSGYLDAKMQLGDDGFVYYCDPPNGGCALLLPKTIETSPLEGKRLKELLPFELPSQASCLLNVTAVIGGDFSDEVYRSGRLRVEVKSVGSEVNGKPLVELSDGQIFNGVWEIICDDQGRACKSVFYPEGGSDFSYCANYNGKKILSTGVFSAVSSLVKCHFPEDSSFQKGRNYFRGKGKFCHVKNANSDRNYWAPDYRFIFEPADVNGKPDEGECKKMDEALIVPGDPVVGFVHVIRTSPDAVIVRFTLDRGAMEGKKFLNTDISGPGCAEEIDQSYIHIVEISNRKELSDRFKDFEIGESATFRCGAEFVGSLSGGNPNVCIKQVGEKTGDDRGDRKVMDFKEGDIDIDSMRLRGKLVINGFDIDHWYFVLDEGMGPYFFSRPLGRYESVAERVVLNSDSKLGIFKYGGGGVLDCDTLNSLTLRDRSGKVPKKTFAVEVVLKNTPWHDIRAAIVRIGKELTVTKDGLSEGGLSGQKAVKKEESAPVAEGRSDEGDGANDSDREKKLNSLARALGGEFHNGAYENGDLETGCVLKGELVVRADNPTFGEKGMVFRLEPPAPGVAYLVSNGFGGMGVVPGELPVVNEHEMTVVLPPDCMPDKDKETKVSRCEVMFCDPNSRYPGMCSVFLLKILKT